MLDKGPLNGTAERGAVLGDSMASRGGTARRRGGKTGFRGDRRSAGATAGGRGLGVGKATTSARGGSVPRGDTSAKPREQEADGRSHRQAHPSGS
jgi:hypothetical protein